MAEAAIDARFLSRARQSLAGAESEFTAGRYDNCESLLLRLFPSRDRRPSAGWGIAIWQRKVES